MNIYLKKHGEIKNYYCINHNIKMIRIKYSELENININYIKYKIYGK